MCGNKIDDDCNGLTGISNLKITKNIFFKRKPTNIQMKKKRVIINTMCYVRHWLNIRVTTTSSLIATPGRPNRARRSEPSRISLVRMMNLASTTAPTLRRAVEVSRRSVKRVDFMSIIQCCCRFVHYHRQHRQTVACHCRLENSPWSGVSLVIGHFSRFLWLAHLSCFLRF